MPRKRKNKSGWVGDRQANQSWFKNNLKRQRRRNKVAKQSRKRNRN